MHIDRTDVRICPIGRRMEPTIVQSASVLSAGGSSAVR